MQNRTRTANTIKHLRLCAQARRSGIAVSLTTDPTWLVHMAINRRAGWLDDPSHSRGSAHPTPDGRYPPKAAGDPYQHLRRIARDVNTARLIVRSGQLGEWRALILKRIPERIEVTY